MLYPVVSHYLLFIIYPEIPITHFRPGLAVDYEYYGGYIESFEIQGYTNQYNIYIYVYPSKFMSVVSSGNFT